ncbi:MULTISPECIES: Rne/Rng family ribonuclease [Desulfitobacterium]|uniref:RNAse G n=1 Tax=Desulfitobacterium dehalogenans (strain ATCC 51507 / DSM 9161 / JW/IU-DC1) TaxID=756499 RepID=I4ADF1_DESDJ|nr:MULTISPECIES: Rne/Rng family ribonuclease [Desulfitobacterium]AFM01986.1 RNAse G [Desulfitobacterium dehalogenans ATCC 51507]
MKEIVLQGQAQRMRAAVLEDRELVEVHEEEGSVSRLVGNIYRGRVINVLPGMQAAFVDIGLEKNAFLYVGDAVPFQYEEDEKLPLPHELRVEQVLKPRQEMLVQITKEPVGSKGARITTNLTIPGRYAVLMPNTEYVGVSRKITEEEERERLREIAREACPEGKGIIVRTLAKGIEGKELADDFSELVALWERLEKKIPHVAIPGLVHQDVDLVSRAIRDWVDQEVKIITVNQPDVAVGMHNALLELGHPAANHVQLVYKEDIFSDYGIDDKIRQALRPKVWLKSGGYLVIQQTEALTVIDVNTGKYVGDKSLQDTILHINQEAALEIARQLRLRNLGGIIVIDFIDMTSEEDKEQLLNVLEKAVARDKLKCQVMGLTQLGLVEMTRKKVGQTLEVRYGHPCSHCDGSGRI